MIYGGKYGENTKPKGLSSSLGANSTSPKYQHQMNKTVVNFGQSRVEHRPELQKKFSYDKGKSNYSSETSQKNHEKTNIKYIRSQNNLYKGENGYIQISQAKREQMNVHNREEMDSPTMIKPQYDSKFPQGSNVSPKYSLQQKHQVEFNKFNHSTTPVSTNNSLNTSTNTNSPMSQTSLGWKPKTTSPQTVLTNN